MKNVASKIIAIAILIYNIINIPPVSNESIIHMETEKEKC